MFKNEFVFQGLVLEKLSLFLAGKCHILSIGILVFVLCFWYCVDFSLNYVTIYQLKDSNHTHYFNQELNMFYYFKGHDCEILSLWRRFRCDS